MDGLKRKADAATNARRQSNRSSAYTDDPLGLATPYERACGPRAAAADITGLLKKSRSSGLNSRGGTPAMANGGRDTGNISDQVALVKEQRRLAEAQARKATEEALLRRARTAELAAEAEVSDSGSLYRYLAQPCVQCQLAVDSFHCSLVSAHVPAWRVW